MILTIESSTDISSLGLFDEEYNLLSSVSYQSRNDMAKNFFNRLDFLLCEKKKEDLTAIITTIGPGSFTGVRIGVITAKMLAIELNIPIIGISALNATANPFLNLNGLVIPVINARRKELYYKMYQNGVEIIPASAGNAAKIKEDINNFRTDSNEPVTIIGITDNLPEDLLEMINNYTVIYAETSPHSILKSTILRLQNNDFDDAMTLAPIYLRSATDR